KHGRLDQHSGLDQPGGHDPYSYFEDPLETAERFGPPGSFEAPGSFNAFEPGPPPSDLSMDRPPDVPMDRPVERPPEPPPVAAPRGRAALSQPRGHARRVRGGLERLTLGPGRTERIYRTEPPPPAAMNLFAELGRSDPDDTPTELVPRLWPESPAGGRT